MISQDLIDSYVRDILALSREYEFPTFWLGTRVKGVRSEAEALPIKNEVNRRVGEAIERTLPVVGTPEWPVVRFELLYPEGGVEVSRVRPLLLYGRYCKLSRTVPQSRWPCRVCGGRGCRRCNGTGKVFATSLEEIIAAPILAVTRAAGTKLHSVGREDVDACTLGRGRPFVLEFIRPRLRSLDLDGIVAALNRTHAETLELREAQWVDEGFLERMRRMHPDKTYRAEVECAVPAPRAAVERLAALRDLVLAQETPRRVLHRRPNLLRRRAIRHCAVAMIEPGDPVSRFVLTVRAQAGAYIKEFISGDEGRTHPSLTALLSRPCACARLDVLDVHCDPIRDPATRTDEPPPGEAPETTDEE